MVNEKVSDAYEELDYKETERPIIDWIMSYGWAVLIVLVIIATLVYFGVF